jgi:ElaB/YqjD/DUF883 family membrane-anchored ribosome-binding protein
MQHKSYLSMMLGVSMEKEQPNLSSTHISNQAHRVVEETKKLGDEIYEEGKEQLEAFQGEIKQQSDQLIEKIREKPLAAVALAAGIGFILARIL